MAEKTSVPEIRFKGFTEPWEQRKLGEVADIAGGGTPSTNNPEYWDGEINWYAPAEIGEQIFVSSSSKKITADGLKNSSAKILPIGTVLFTSRAGIGKTAILLVEAATNQGFQSVIPNQNELDSYFIYSRTNEIKQYAETVGAGSTFTEVSGKQMEKMPILVPGIEEQRRIARFFQQLDSLITLHQRKHDKLTVFKKSMLEKMFPKTGCDTPEIRFNGFSDPWEQRKLGECCEFITKGTTPSNKSGVGEVNFVKVESIIDGTVCRTSQISREEHDGSLRRSRLKDNDILFSIAGTLGRTAKVEKSILPANTNQALAIIRGYGFDSNFLLTSLSGRVVVEFVRRNPTVGAQPNLSLEQVGSLEIWTPERQEQSRIGAFFQRLDSLITLHQRKLELLKRIKQSCLDKMFV